MRALPCSYRPKGGCYINLIGSRTRSGGREPSLSRTSVSYRVAPYPYRIHIASASYRIVSRGIVSYRVASYRYRYLYRIVKNSIVSYLSYLYAHHKEFVENALQPGADTLPDGTPAPHNRPAVGTEVRCYLTWDFKRPNQNLCAAFVTANPSLPLPYLNLKNILPQIPDILLPDPAQAPHSSSSSSSASPLPQPTLPLFR